ncbi:hypothetical protein BDW22DRAFT_1361367 [Trametopsis cervina]|nr:hypothetical protein BDW22DRAFT_1361367 [Trametopsis cervina]
MFRGGQPNPYDDIVAKTTDENLTSENWELIITLCDKVQEEGEQGARNVVAAILKRLMHRTSNVQLYTLTLAESLTKNCGITVHREISSKAFTQGLEKLIMDRNTHEKVRKRALALIAEWAGEWEKDPTLGVMEECYTNLKSKGYKFDGSNEQPPPVEDDALRRREEEELQRVLEMSMQDKGGRNQWSEYSLASTSGAGASGASARPAGTSSSRPQPQSQAQPVYGGYVPSSSPALPSGNTSASVAAAAAPTTPSAAASYVPSSPVSSVKSQDSIPVVTRVRALHTFEPTEAGELAFEKGDIIKVVDRGYKDWWRGQLKGRTGIFPVNYVEPLPEPTAAELAKEAEQEAAVFSQAANVDRLLQMLRQMDPAKDNLADNEEIQELYRTCMSVRPKIVKLIDKYSQKRADLVSMNETFVKARSIFDRMMEDSLARHTSAGYDPRPGYGQSPYPRVDAGPQGYSWNPAGYDPGAYAGYPAQGPYPVPEQYPQQQYVDPAAYQQAPPQGAYPPQPYGQPSGPAPVPYGAPSHAQGGPQPQPYPSGAPPSQGPGLQSQPYGNGAAPPGAPGTAPGPTPAPATSPPIQQYPEQVQTPFQSQVQPQSQATAQPQPQQQLPPQLQQAQQQQPQPQPQQQPQPQPQSQPAAQPAAQAQAEQPAGGPPFVFDPNATYPDPNIQAWAQYYAQGGTDPTGAVYFISVPGVKEAAPLSPPAQIQPDPVSQQPAAQPQGYQLYDGPAGQGATPGTMPLNVRHDQPHSPTGQPNNANIPYGASPYAPVGATSPSHEYGALPNQFAGLSVGGQGHPAGTPGVGAPA